MGDSPAGEARQRTPGGEKAAKRRIVSAGRGRINKAAAMTPRSGANGEGVHFSAEVRPADGGAAKELFGGSGKVGDGSLQSVLDEIEVVTERLGVPDPNLKKKMLWLSHLPSVLHPSHHWYRSHQIILAAIRNNRHTSR